MDTTSTSAPTALRETPSRREVLKKGALVAGTAVWAAPTLQVLTMSSAHAAATSVHCVPAGTADASGSLVKISGVLGTALPVIGQTKTHAATPSPLTSSANGGGPAGSVSTLTYSLLTSTSASTVGTSASVARADVKAASVTFSLPGTIPGLPTLSVAATAIDSHAVATATQTAASTTGSSAGLGSLVINGTTVPTTPGTTTLAGFITVVLGEVVTTAGPVPANQEATVTATACRITVALPGVPKFEIVLGSTTAKADLATSC